MGVPLQHKLLVWQKQTYINPTHQSMTLTKTTKYYLISKSSFCIYLFIVMVLLLEKLGRSLKFYSKMENHHHHHDHPSESLSASLQAFRSDVSNILNQLSLNSKPGSEIVSLLWIHQCFVLLPNINKAFAKLGVDIDYPISKWEAASVEEYLKYSLNLLELLNSISSSLSHLGQARLSLSHALSLVENSPSLAIKRLKPIQPGKFSKDCSEDNKEDGEIRLGSGKEWVIQQALMVMKNIGFWVCGIVLSGLCADGSKPYLEMKQLASGFVNSSLIGLDSSICQEIMEKMDVLKEVIEVNDAVDSLIPSILNGESNDAAEELQRRLEVFEKLLEGVGKEVDQLFSEILAWRNELIDSLRLQKQ